MSIVPAFQIGWWNAWWFMTVFVLQWLAVLLLPGNLMKRTGDVPGNQTRRYEIVTFVTNGLWVAATLYSIFLPLQLGTPWLWVGLMVFIAGLVMLVLTTIAIATTPADKPFTSGVYRVSRHPGYLSMVIIYLGVSIATASWVFLLVTVVTFFLLLYGVRMEETYCCTKFGETYRSYMVRTPRWIGLPGPVAR
jgi:protein-S-isoprenylcysteine O-methyltransferase Ste14